MKPDRIWHVVMNSNRARILRTLAGPHEHAAVELTIQGSGRHLRDILQDRPTRSFASGSSGRRSAVEPGSDPLREDAIHFLREIFDFLGTEWTAHAFDGLVVIASPDVMGLWRAEIPHNLQPAVRREITKNLVRLPSSEIGPAIRALIEE